MKTLQSLTQLKRYSALVAKTCRLSALNFNKRAYIGNNNFLSFRTVVLKVGGIAPLGTILRGKGAKKTKGAIGGRK